jgi:hypothetical protein
MMKKHGEGIAREAYGHSNEKLFGSMADLRDLPAGARRNQLMQRTGAALRQIMTIEAPHKAALQQIAIDVVANMYNISEADRNKLKGFLRVPQHNEPIEQPDEEEYYEDGEVDSFEEEEEDITSEVHKRYTMNLMSQGSAIHNMHDSHLQEEIKDRLDQIDPRLTDFYSQFGRGSSHMYWLYDINTALNSKLPQAMATVHFDDEGSIIAQAPIFPVLVQELIKGVIMLISHHQFEGMSTSKTKRILAAADTLHDEFPQIMVGPKVWRAFILALPSEYRGRLLEVVMTLARSHPKELDIIMDKLGECIAQRQDPRTSSASSALRDLLERSLTEETPEDVAAMLPDEESDDDYGTEEDDIYGTDEDDLNESRSYSFRTINEAT